MAVSASASGTTISWLASGPEDYSSFTLHWSGSDGTSGSKSFFGSTTTSHGYSVTVSGSVTATWPGGSGSLGSASATTGPNPNPPPVDPPPVPPPPPITDGAALSAGASTSRSVNWSIGSLSNPFTTDYYISAILSNSPAVNDSTTGPSGVLDSMSPGAPGGNSHFTPLRNTTGGNAFSPGGQYRLYGTMRAANGRYYTAQYADVVMPQDTTAPSITSASVTSVTSNSITMSASATDESGIAQLRFHISDNGTPSPPASSNTPYRGSVFASSGSYTFTGLIPGYYYTLAVYAVDASPTGNTSLGWNIYDVRTTPPPLPPPASSAVTNAIAKGSTQFEWFISGLGNPFNTTHYLQVAVFTSPFSNDSATQPAGLISSTAAPASGASTTTPTILTSGAVSADQSYTVYGGAQVASNGRWYTAGEKTFWTRPLNFSWTTAKTKDANFSLLAAEWNGLTSKINGFRLYKEVGTAFFTTAYTNNDFTAAMFNEARNAIAGMAPPVAVPGTVVKDDGVLASLLNGLRNSLNSIL